MAHYFEDVHPRRAPPVAERSQRQERSEYNVLYLLRWASRVKEVEQGQLLRATSIHKRLGERIQLSGAAKYC